MTCTHAGKRIKHTVQVKHAGKHSIQSEQAKQADKKLMERK
jgi:hypothetical protein